MDPHHRCLDTVLVKKSPSRETIKCLSKGGSYDVQLCYLW